MAKKNTRYVDAAQSKRTAAPKLPYRPRDPETYRPNIGMIACGGITKHHLQEYRKAGYAVTALCDVVVNRAKTLKSVKRCACHACRYTPIKNKI